MKKNYYFATWLRAFGAVLILLCHYVGASGNAYIQHTGQIFNIGVEIFFILSGFLFGIRQYQFKDNVWHWYKRRLKRIYIPLEIFLSFLLIVYLVKGMQITPGNWLLGAAGMIGFCGGLKGANHTWFVTAIILCYLVTPLIGKLSLWLSEQKDKQIISVFVAGGGYHTDITCCDSNRVCFYFGSADRYI